MIKRNLLVKLHLVMAAITLPFILMFFITGALYTADYKPSYSVKEYRVKLNAPLKYDYVWLKNIAHKELARLNINDPSGKAKLRTDKKRKSFKLSWQGKNHNISLRPSSVDHSIAVITVRTPSWYKRFMRFHKAKGGDLFDILSIISSIILLLIVISGVVIGLQVKLFKKLTVYSLSFGSIFFILLIIYTQN